MVHLRGSITWRFVELGSSSVYYPDLSAYEYRQSLAEGGGSASVGWLDVVASFAVGTVPSEFAERLRLLSVRPVNLTRGWHPCPFCVAELQSSRSHIDGPTMMDLLQDLGALGNGEIVVRGRSERVYVA